MHHIHSQLRISHLQSRLKSGIKCLTQVNNIAFHSTLLSKLVKAIKTKQKKTVNTKQYQTTPKPKNALKNRAFSGAPKREGKRGNTVLFQNHPQRSEKLDSY